MKTIQLQQADGKHLLLAMGQDEDGAQAWVRAGGRRYGTLAELASAHPELGAAPLPLCCTLSLHFAGSANFLPIDDPDAFRLRYKNLIERAQDLADAGFSTADFGPFDTSEVTRPQLRDDKLVFYVEDNMYGVPYRVEAPWLAPVQGSVRFALLPEA